jgi:hypothetical protein
MSKRGSSNKQQRERRNPGDLNRKSTHEMRTHDGMIGKVNPYNKMMGIKEK